MNRYQLSFIIIFIIFLSSCNKDNKTCTLPANTTFVNNAIQYDKPIRVFTSQGEISDAGIKAAFVKRFPSYFISEGNQPWKDSIKTNASNEITWNDYGRGILYNTECKGGQLKCTMKDTLRAGFISDPTLHTYLETQRSAVLDRDYYYSFLSFPSHYPQVICI